MAKAKHKLAELLLRRKELQGKVDMLQQIKQQMLYAVVTSRQKVSDSIDEAISKVPVLDAGQVTAEFDWHARQLRLVDAAIQQANWTTEVAIDQTVMSDYVKPKE